MKKLKLKKEIKMGLVAIAIVSSVAMFYSTINNIANEQLLQEANEYRECIQEQSDSKGYIIRYSCSSNYATLDKVAGIEYTQIGYDLYLK